MPKKEKQLQIFTKEMFLKKFSIKVLILVTLIGFSLGSVVCTAISFYLNKDKITVSSIKSIRQNYYESDGYKFINPLLYDNRPQSTDLTTLRASIQSIADTAIANNKADSVSVYYKDLVTSDWIGVNLNESYYPASLLKVPTMMAFFRYAEDHPEILSKKIYYDGKSDQDARENLRSSEQMTEGTYSVEELVERMVKYSDNNAVKLLSTVFSDQDFHYFTQPLSDLGIETLSTTDDYMTVGKYAIFFRVLFNSTYLSRNMSEKALGLLSKTDFSNGLVRDLPKGVMVAHKFGELTLENQDRIIEKRELHDCGIVYEKDRPYLLCVMTKGAQYSDLEDMIAGISLFVYNKR